MVSCDMCGTEETLFRTIVEDVELNVCKNCSKFGKVLGEVKQELTEKKIDKAVDEEPEVVQILAEDFHEKIKTFREKMGLRQEEFAKKINEKVSLVHKIESGHFEPPLALARKLEKILGTKLIEEYKEEGGKRSSGKGESFTIGDFIKVKKK